MMNEKKPLGVYIHVPFCKEKCSYCDFYSLSGAGHMDAYVAALTREMQGTKRVASDFVVDTVYFGGGTPSCLGGVRIAQMLAEVKACFFLAQDAEITVECNPESATGELMQTLAACGVNRVSLGVQSADDGELKRLGRLHTFAEAQQAVQLARDAGIYNISLDLMYGLPGQTQQRFERSLSALLALEPTHLSAYSLKLETNTPMGRENPELPDGDMQAEWYLAMCDTLRERGYIHYEISNFAMPGYEARHNSKYWDFSDYIGLGPGAHAFFSGRRFYNRADLQAYLVNPCKISLEEAGTPKTLEEHLMLRLRTAQGEAFAVLEEAYGVDIPALRRALQPLVSQGLLQMSDNGFGLTEQGFLVSNSIILYVTDAAQPRGEFNQQ